MLLDQKYFCKFKKLGMGDLNALDQWLLFVVYFVECS